MDLKFPLKIYTLQNTISLKQQFGKFSFRSLEHAAKTFIKVPFLGAVSYLTLAVSPFCVLCAVLWAAYRRHHFAWIGQDILVRSPFPVLYIINLNFLKCCYIHFLLAYALCKQQNLCVIFSNSLCKLNMDMLRCIPLLIST